MRKTLTQVFEEDDYSVFKKLDYNRDVTSDRRNKLVASFSAKDILNPIIVNEKMEIIDGQGRYEARKMLGLPIQYIIVEGTDIEDCRRMNRYNTKWDSLDFCQSYADGGNINYMTLLSTCSELEIGVNRALRLANKANKVSAKRGGFSIVESGSLIFNQSDAEMITKCMSIANEITEALLYEGRRNEAFFTAVKVMCETEGYSHSKMLNNCRFERSRYNQMSNLEAQLGEFSRIYNRGSKKESSRIYFEDYMRNKGSNVRNYDDTDTHGLVKRVANRNNVSTL